MCQRLKDHVKSNVSKYRKGVNFEFLIEQSKILMGEDNDKTLEIELREALKVLVSEEVLIAYGPNKMRPSVKICKDLYGEK